MSSKPETVIKPPNRFLGVFDIKELKRRIDLLFALAERDIKVRYRRTLIGIGWAIIQPLFQMIIFSIIFGKFAKIETGQIPYPVYIYSALVPWQFFSRSLTEASMSVLGNAGMISKIYFPRVILPLSVILSAGFDFLFVFAVLILLMIIYGIFPSLNIIFFPLFLILQLMCALGVALWLAPINVKYRDVKYTLQFLNQLWFFATPIVYPPHIIPEKWRVIQFLNPMTGIVEGYRWSLLGTQPPESSHLLISISTILLLFISGFIYFHRQEKDFADIV
jgi:lipopolysaccharide transport system permease protein